MLLYSRIEASIADSQAMKAFPSSFYKFPSSFQTRPPH